MDIKLQYNSTSASPVFVRDKNYKRISTEGWKLPEVTLVIIDFVADCRCLNSTRPYVIIIIVVYLRLSNATKQTTAVQLIHELIHRTAKHSCSALYRPKTFQAFISRRSRCTIFCMFVTSSIVTAYELTQVRLQKCMACCLQRTQRQCALFRGRQHYSEYVELAELISMNTAGHLATTHEYVCLISACVRRLQNHHNVNERHALPPLDIQACG